MAKELILVVDDDASIVNLLKESLEAEGFQVISGYDGESALQLASQRRPRLVVIDMNMPGPTGLETVTAMRQQDLTKAIPVILLTGESAQQVASGGSSPDRVTHVEKPVDLERFNALVKACLQKYPA